MSQISTDFFHILLLVNGLKFGGAEGAVLRLGSALQNAGHRVKVLAIGDSADYPIPDQLNIDYLQPCPWWLPSFLKTEWRVRQFRHTLFRLEETDGSLDVVIGNMNLSNQILAKSGISNALYYVRNNLVLEGHYAKRPERHKRKYHDILNGKHLLCLSPYLSEELKESDYIQPASVSVIRNVQDIHSIRVKSEEKVNAIPGKNYLLHIGRYTPQKRHDLLIEALVRMKGCYYTVMVTDETEKLKKKALSLGLPESSFEVHGFQKNIYPWMKNAVAVLNCSDYEGLCNVLLEATALNCRVIATDCPYGPREILGSGNPDMLIPCDNIDALVEKLRDVFTNRPSPNPCGMLDELAPDYIVRKIEESIRRVQN